MAPDFLVSDDDDLHSGFQNVGHCYNKSSFHSSPESKNWLKVTSWCPDGMVTYSQIFQNVSNHLWQLSFSGKPWPHPDNHTVWWNKCSKNSILSSIQICNYENAKHIMYEKLEKYLLNVWNCINVVSHVFMTVSPHYS